MYGFNTTIELPTAKPGVYRVAYAQFVSLAYYFAIGFLHDGIAAPQGC